MSEAITPEMVKDKPRTMDFPDAMSRIIDGKQVSRVSWGNSDYCFIKDGWLVIYTKGQFHTWSINDGDMYANDWVVNETN